MNFKLPHDILCSRAAHDNRRAAGAVFVIRNQRLVSPLIPQDVIGPAARLTVSSVFSVDHSIRVHSCEFVVNNPCNPSDLWFLKFGCGLSAPGPFVLIRGYYYIL